MGMDEQQRDVEIECANDEQKDEAPQDMPGDADTPEPRLDPDAPAS